jgi:tetratricopeptide (TPR) repeat protein
MQMIGGGEDSAFTGEWSLAYVYFLLGKPAEAIAPYRRALKVALELGHTAYASTISGALARALSRTGEYKAALAESERARALTGPGDIISEINWRSAKARALRRRRSRPTQVRRVSKDQRGVRRERDAS